MRNIGTGIYLARAPINCQDIDKSIRIIMRRCMPADNYLMAVKVYEMKKIKRGLSEFLIILRERGGLEKD